MKGHVKFKHVLALFILAVTSFLYAPDLRAQSFYREKEPKTDFIKIGLGAGTFFAAPRPSYDSIVNEIMPVLSLGAGRRLGNHLRVIGTFSFQPFSSKEFLLNDSGEESFDPIFDGFNYALDVTPTFNLVPYYHHMSRPLLDLNLGVGIGYLLTYRTEKFVFNEKYYEFNLFESSVYIPVRLSTSFKIGILSDLEVEGAFFNAWLNDSKTESGIQKDSDHFAQLNLVYKKLIR